jgi:hypothetical protein
MRELLSFKNPISAKEKRQPLSQDGWLFFFVSLAAELCHS